MKTYLKNILGLDDMSFPLQKNESGIYPIARNQNGFIRCPLCGCSSFSARTLIELRCNTCLAELEHFGTHGIREKQ